MSKASTVGGHVQEAELMARILEVRFTDLEEEASCCKQLLAVAQPGQSDYAYAFANVYLFDSSLALGDYPSCDFYLSRASLLCRSNNYEDLLLVLCNLAGLYYLKLKDEQTALRHYLEGLRLARVLGDFSLEGKLLNNVGLGFAGRGDWGAAKSYFQRAVTLVDEGKSGAENLVSYLCNLAEMYQQLHDAQGSERALSRSEQSGELGQYQKFRLACCWAAHYALLGDKEKSGAAADSLLELGLLGYTNKAAVCDMCTAMLETMTEIADEKRVEFFLSILEGQKNEIPLSTLYRIQCQKIVYWERTGAVEKLDNAYREYYEIAMKMGNVDDQTRAQSILSRIQLTTVQMERREMNRENVALEAVNQLDELTRLYNRRYFNKLISKVTQMESLKTLGYIMVDVDYFKQYNDNYGHFAGDTALKAVAEALRTGTEEDGIMASRYGGDEFACLCVNQTDAQIECYIEGVMEALRQKEIEHAHSLCNKGLTISIGYSNEPVGSVEMEELIELADRALYQVKKAGRNGWARRHRHEAAEHS